MTRKIFTLTALVVLGAFGLRVWRLGMPSFWWDDAYSTMVASRSLREIVSTLAREDFHPPLHYFLLHYWMRVAGLSEFALRFPSVAAGVLTVAAAGSSARRLFTVRVAPMASLVFAVSPFLWYYSQEARMFAVAVLCGILSLYFCARATDTDYWVDWAAYGLFVALGLWDFYYFVFIPIACLVWIILTRARAPALRGWLIATAAAVVTFLPWLPIFLARESVWSNAVFSLDNPPRIVGWTWAAFMLGLPTIGLYRSPILAVILGLGAVCAIAGVVWSIADGRGRSGALLAGIAVTLPLLAMTAISAFKPVYHPRYAILALPGLLLLLSGMIVRGWSAPGHRVLTTRWLSAGTAALVLGTSIYGLIRLNVDSSYSRDDYRSAIAYIHREELPNDAIIHNAIPPFWYYDHGPAPAAYFPSRPYTEGNVVDELNDVVSHRSRLWYLDNLSVPNDPDGFLDNQLRLHARQLEQQNFGPLRVQLWEVSGEHPFSQARFLPTSIQFADQFVADSYGVSGDLVGGNLVNIEVNLTALRAPTSDVGFWVALVDPTGFQWGRADVQPHDDAIHLSSAWRAHTSAILRFDLPIAIGTPPGRYHLVVGGYRLADLAGLDVLDVGGHPIGQTGTLGDVEIGTLGPQTEDTSLPRQSEIPVGTGLELATWNFDSAEISPGEALPVTLLWRATRQLSDLNATIQIKAAGGQVIGSVAGPVGGPFRTGRWPQNQVVREQRTIPIGATAIPGHATVVIQLEGEPEATLGTVLVRNIRHEFAAPVLTHPIDAQFGDSVSLIGYDLSAPTAEIGRPLTVSLGWRADRLIPLSYHVFLQLLDPADKIWAQWDGVPRNWSYPMTSWLPGEYVLDRYPLQSNPAASHRDLTLVVGLYDAVTGQRLRVVSKPGTPAADHLVLQTVRVAP